MKHHKTQKVRDLHTAARKDTTHLIPKALSRKLKRAHMSAYVRPASHAGPNGRGWYEAIPERLKATLDGYFGAATHHYEGQRRMTALIAPHAGMAYSGRTAAEAFALFREYFYAKGSPGAQLERVFVLGPCHVKGFEGCELSGASAYETPFGPLRVDVATVDSVMASLKKVGVAATKASRRTEDAEHSIELETPYLAHILHHPPSHATPAAIAAAGRVSIVPIIVGWTERAEEKALYEVLKPYMDDARNFFVISSDFCHWGSRFSYSYHYKRTEYPNIGDAIIAMDRAAMDLLEHRDMEGWYDYLKTTRNTICGRAPIGVVLHRWAAQGSTSEVKFVHYSQSNKCEDANDSSVSYAAAVVME